MAEARAVIEITGDPDGLERAAREASGMLGAVGRALKDVARQAAAFAVGFAAFEGLRRTFNFAADAAIGFNSQLEQIRIGFTTMLGSAQQADQFLRQLADFAAQTPFEFPELVEATRRLMAFGFAAEDVVPMLRAIGDAAAGLGIGEEGINRIIYALGQMRAKAKVSAEEMLQLTEAGVPAWEILAQATGKSTAEVQKLVSKGLIPADQAIRALVVGMGERFPGMMKNLEDSWQGLTSTIIDNARMMLAQAFEPVFNAIKERVLKPLRDALNEARDAFERGGLREALRTLIPKDVQDAVARVRSDLDVLRQLIASGEWQQAGQRIGEALRSAFAQLRAQGMEIGNAIADWFSSIDWVALGKRVGDAAIPFIVGFASGLFGPQTWQAFLKYWDEFLMAALLTALAPARLLAPLRQLLKRIPLVGTILEWVLGQLRSVGESILSLAGAIFGPVGRSFIDGILRGLAERGPGLLPKLRDLVDTAIVALYTYADDFAKAALRWVGRLGEGLGSGIASLRNRVIQLINSAIDSPLGEAIERAVRYGGEIVRGLWQGIASLWGWLKERVASFITDTIPGLIQRLLQIGSPSRVMERQGLAIAEGLARGMYAGMVQVRGAAEEMAKTAKDAAKKAVSEIRDQLGEALSALDARLSIVRNSLQLWAIQNKVATDSVQFLQQSIRALQVEMGLIQQKIAATQQAYARMVAVKGENSAEALKLRASLVELQLEYARLGQQVDEARRKMREAAEEARRAAASTMQAATDLLVGTVERAAAATGRDPTEVVGSIVERIRDAARKMGFGDIPADLIRRNLSLFTRGGTFRDALEELLRRTPGMAHGGRVLAPGLALVGEKGPELLRLPRGAEVMPLSRSSNITLNLTVNVQGGTATDGRRLAEELLPHIVRALRMAGVPA